VCGVYDLAAAVAGAIKAKSGLGPAAGRTDGGPGDETASSAGRVPSEAESWEEAGTEDEGEAYEPGEEEEEEDEEDEDEEEAEEDDAAAKAPRRKGVAQAHKWVMEGGIVLDGDEVIVISDDEC